MIDTEHIRIKKKTIPKKYPKVFQTPILFKFDFSLLYGKRVYSWYNYSSYILTDTSNDEALARELAKSYGSGILLLFIVNFRWIFYGIDLYKC